MGANVRRAVADADATTTEESSAGAFRELVIITGFSGAGKSTAMNVFEDAGYFCVDNLPPEMIRGLIELFMHEGSKVEHAAVVSDVRGGEFFETLSGVV
ncbi:MAG: RNase adaptor protein RapZ, partial [Solirubrobacteraceae bacterium]|nr:RNase adaptor protein RapZ [Solirubrobacteraceae bacterium]